MSSRANAAFYRAFRHQLFFLSLTGFVPFSLLAPRKLSENTILLIGKISRIIGILLLIGTWLSALFLSHMLIMRMGSTLWLFPTSNPIIQGAIASTIGLVNIRAAMVLTIMFYKRNTWYAISGQFGRLAKTVRKPPSVHIFGMITCGLFFITTVLWAYAQVAILVGRNISFWASESFTPIPIVIYVYQLVIAWTFFCAFPFFLSQILLSALMTCAYFQNGSLKEAHVWQNEIAEKMRNGSMESEALLRESSALSIAGTVHHEAVELCELLNGSFRRALFFIYGFDCLTAAGNIATLVAGFGDTEVNLTFLYVRIPVIYAILMFISHVTLCLIPMALVKQTGQEICDGYFRIWNISLLRRMDSSSETNKETHLSSEECCRKFGKMCERSPPVFYAGYVCSVSWTLFAKTFVFMASFAVLAYEIIDVTGVRDSLDKLQGAVHNLSIYEKIRG